MMQAALHRAGSFTLPAAVGSGNGSDPLAGLHVRACRLHRRFRRFERDSEGGIDGDRRPLA